MPFERFEQMKVWQEARKLTGLVYALTALPGFRHDSGLCNQVQRSAVSVMANIAEGYERINRKEFIHHLSFAKGSVGELRSHLYVALDLGYISEVQHKNAATLAISISTQLSNFIAYLKKR